MTRGLLFLAALALSVPGGLLAQTFPGGAPLVVSITGTFRLACSPPAADGTLRDCTLEPLGVAAASPPANAPPPAPALAAPPQAAAPANAATATTPKDAFQRIADLTQVDISVPSSPAFAVLGISPDKVQRPGTIRDFVSSVVRGLGPDGKPVQGLAIDMSPASVFFKSQIIGGTNYMPGAQDHNDLHLNNYWKRVLARTTVSLANTTADSSGSGAARMAWGLRLGLVDYGDPGLYADRVASCLQSLAMPPIPAGRTVGEAPADVNACDPTRNPAYSLWAKPALYAGYGRSWYSHSGSATARLPDAKAWWVTGSYGFAGQPTTGAEDLNSLRTLVQVYAGRRINDRASDASDPLTLVRQDSSEAIVRLKLGKDTWHGFAELGRSRVHLGSSETQKVRHTALGAEFKLSIAEDTWLKVASVRERGFADGKDRNSGTVSLKLGVPFLTLPGPAASK